MTRAAPLGFLMLCWLLCACGGSPMDESDAEPLGTAESAQTIENAMVSNAIVPNAIVPNAIVPNAIVPNALDPGSLDAASLAAIQDPGDRGVLSRMFLKYTVGCALDPTQSFSFSWTDAVGLVHHEIYWGILGIAPSWADQPLTEVTRQRLVSACLAGRTNYFGVPVLISMRSLQSPLVRSVTLAELTGFPNVEGAFWGNLFGPDPHLYACYNPSTTAISRAMLRDCAAGYPDGQGHVLSCGPIVITGSCDDVCQSFAGIVYTSCNDPPGSGTSTSAVITTALP